MAPIRHSKKLAARAGKEEFPILRPRGLKVEKTKGRGNCLFHAVSKQIYGSDSHHAKIRAAVCEFMETHPEDFKYFIPAKASGGLRSSSRRRGHVDEVFDIAAIDKTFTNYVNQMKKPGTYADNSEIAAVSAVYGYTIEVFSAAKNVLTIKWQEKAGVNGTLRLAHHSFAHFSSVVDV